MPGCPTDASGLSIDTSKRPGDLVLSNTPRLACAGLRKNYSAAGHTQVVRVPQLTRLTVADAASVTAQPWNGQRSGVVVLHVQDTTTLIGDISGA